MHTTWHDRQRDDRNADSNFKTLLQRANAA